jgi:hypothetical protein
MSPCGVHMDFVQNCRLRSFSDGLHLESVGEGKLHAHGNVFRLFFSLFFSLFLLPTQIFLQPKQTKNEMKNK